MIDPKPYTWAYQYHDTLRFNGGQEVNGARPSGTVPFYDQSTIDALVAEIQRLKAPAQAPADWCEIGTDGWLTLKHKPVSAQTAQEPVARAHISLQDDGPYAELEVLNGALLQPSMSPVNLYAAPISHLWACTGCGSQKTMEQIRGEHPNALSCCPERKMGPVVSSTHQSPDEDCACVGAVIGSHDSSCPLAVAGTERGGIEPIDITGWKLVPDTATEEMWQCGRTADIHPGDSYSKVWRAMFEAAPDVEDCETTSHSPPILQKTAFDAAMAAYWEAKGGTANGVEAAIKAYLAVSRPHHSPAENKG